MSVFEVVDQHGAWKVAAFVAALAAFLLLQALRSPFVVVARGLWLLQHGLNARIAAAAITPSVGREGGNSDV